MNLVAVDGFEHNRAARILRGRHSAISFDAARANDSDMIRIRRINERAPSRLPATFPPDIHRRIIRRISAADNHAVWFQSENGSIAETDTADKIFSGRHQHFATTVSGAG